MLKTIIKILAIIILIIVIYFGFIFGRQAWDHYKLKKYNENLKFTASQNVQVLKDTIYMEFLDEKRTLHVFLPPGYNNAKEKYPVIYMLDGEGLFDDLYANGPEWQLDEHIEKTMAEGGPSAIVIGIENGKRRSEEYKPYLSRRDESENIYGIEFSRFLAHDLKPWVDMRFRTKRDAHNTIIGGASLGGLMAYYVTLTYPDIFGKAIVMSPSFWVSDQVYELHNNTDLTKLKIFLSAGAREGNIVASSKQIYTLLSEAGMDGHNIKFEKQRGFSHNHFTWRNAFKRAYPWIIE